MNREQKAVVIEEIAANIRDSQAIFAVDFRGISVPQAAELRGKLRDLDASFRVVKNSLTERAADKAGVLSLKELLVGPTALTFVRGDAATAAKAIADYARLTQRLAFKGGVMDGVALTPEQVSAISRLLSRDALYGQLVGLVASPLTGLVRTLNALLGGLAIQLGAILEKKESGELPAGEKPEAVTPDQPAEAQAPPVPGIDAPTTQAPAPAETADARLDPPAAETPAVQKPPSPVADPPVAEPIHPTEAAAAPSAEQSPAAAPTQDSGDEVAGAKDAQGDEAQAESTPAAVAPATEEPPSHKENH